MTYPYSNPQYGSFPGNVPGRPPARVDNRAKRKSTINRGFSWAVTYVLVIWGVHILNVLSGGLLMVFGIHPLDPSSLWHIVTAPWLHANWEHLVANTLPGALFVFLIALSGTRVLTEVTLIAMVIGGLGAWFFGGIGTNHIGASGLIYGWLAYLIIRGMFNRSLRQVLLGVVLASLYGGLIWGVLPTQAGVSWQGHLFGGIGGLIAGATITSDDPLALVQRREQKRIQRGR